MDNKRKTMHDVAALAGVSYQTVSRVINHHPSVSEDARRRVLDAIAQLDYRPNRAAQSLAGRRTHTLGATVFGLDFYGPSHMVTSIESAARRAGYDLLLANVRNTTLAEMHLAIDHLRYWDLDGFLLIMPLEGVSYAQLQAICDDKPIVLIGARTDEEAPSVAVDQRHGARLGAEHLIRAGHTRIAELRGPIDWVDAQERHASLVETLAEAGLSLIVSEIGDWTARSGYQAAQRLLNTGQDFSALIAGNDQMALGAIRAFNDQGVSVPGQVSVVGFDDIPEAEFFSPPLTTIRQDFDLLGRMGIDYLIERIHDPRAPVHKGLIIPKLIERRSS